MRLVLIAAVTRDLAIGNQGSLLFHIPADLKRFKVLTMGCPIIMGRKTFESFPNGPLPGRRNIVVTRSAEFHYDGVDVVHSLEDAIAACGDVERAYVIGGGEIYRQALPMADELDLTLIDAECPDADVRFPDVELPEPQFTETDPKSGVRYCFLSVDMPK